MSAYPFSVEVTLEFGNGSREPPPRLKTSDAYMKALHIFTFRMTARRLEPMFLHRLVNEEPRYAVGPAEQTLLEAWRAVCQAGAVAS